MGWEAGVTTQRSNDLPDVESMLRSSWLQVTDPIDVLVEKFNGIVNSEDHPAEYLMKRWHDLPTYSKDHRESSVHIKVGLILPHLTRVQSSEGHRRNRRGISSDLVPG